MYRIRKYVFVNMEIIPNGSYVLRFKSHRDYEFIQDDVMRSTSINMFRCGPIQ